MNPVFLEETAVGSSQPVYFIAEIGGNFHSEEEARLLIEQAQAAGANAVKFQTLEAETITTKENYFFFNDSPKVSQYENFLKSETPKSLQKFVFDYAHQAGITVFTAPSHVKDVEFMETELNCPIYKIGSDLCCHIPLLREVARLQKPIILSTGLATLKEIRRSVDAVIEEGNEQLILLHCVSNYPCAPGEVNLRVMDTLRGCFDGPVGYSDHTVGIDIALASVACGADIVERHFTFDKTAEGPDHELSSTQEELATLIEWSANVRASLGSPRKQPARSELKYRPYNRVAINTTSDIAAGEVITDENVDVRRPAIGIEARHWEQILGRRARRDLIADAPLLWSDLET